MLLSRTTANFEADPVGSHPPARPGWSWHRAGSDRTTIVATPRNPRVGSRACRMVRRKGDVYASGQRCELHHSAGDRERHGTEGWYGYTFRMPGPGEDVPAHDPETAHFVVWQVHHAGNNGPPPLSLMASRYWDRNNQISIHFQVYGGDPNRPTLNHLFLTPTARTAPDPRGHWWEVLFNVGWREDATGWIGAELRRGDQDEWTHAGRLEGIPTWLRGDPGGYRKFGAYFGGTDREQVIDTHGYIRAESRAAVVAWMEANAATPVPDPVPEPDPQPEPEPTPEPNPHRISPALASAIVDTVTRRMTQQAGRARTVLGAEYVGRLRAAGMDGLADALERNVAHAIQTNSDLVVQELAQLLADAEAA